MTAIPLKCVHVLSGVASPAQGRTHARLAATSAALRLSNITYEYLYFFVTKCTIKQAHCVKTFIFNVDISSCWPLHVCCLLYSSQVSAVRVVVVLATCCLRMVSSLRSPGAGGCPSLRVTLPNACACFVHLSCRLFTAPVHPTGDRKHRVCGMHL